MKSKLSIVVGISIISIIINTFYPENGKNLFIIVGTVLNFNMFFIPSYFNLKKATQKCEIF